jgi:hypothetical protein
MIWPALSGEFWADPYFSFDSTNPDEQRECHPRGRNFWLTRILAAFKKVAVTPEML